MTCVACQLFFDFEKYIRKTVIPAIEKVSKWVKQNMPAIKSGLVGVASAMVAFKVASIATTVAQKGLKGAIVATTVAQKALALAQAATPWGLIATAVIGVGAALIAMNAATKEARGPVEVLTAEELELVKASEEAAEAFREQQKATKEAMQGSLAEMDYIADLADELDTLVDKKGKVKKADEDRVKFILNALKEATGEEYELVDGTIKKYKDLEKSVKDVIAQKTANLLLDDVNEAFTAALKEEAQAWDALQLKQKEYDAQLAATQKAENDYKTFKDEYNEKLASGYYAFREAEQAADSQRLIELDEIQIEEQGYLDERQTELDKAADNYGLYADQIITYEQAQEAAAAGNYQAVREILAGKGSVYSDHADTVENETDRTLRALQKEAVDAGRKAELTRKNFENGVKGYTEQMVTEADENYEKAMDEFANAYADAEMVGEDITEGMTAGAENKRSGLLAKARSLVKGFLNAVRDEADTHSPSKKSMKIFEDIGDGAVIGTENKTKDVKKAATRQMAEVLDAYGSPELNAQKVYRNIAEQQSARQLSGQQAVASSYDSMLGQILTAIKEGKVLTIDGDALVGATADRMDSALGRRRALASRGAI